jgi:Phosphotransferase enzyme family
MSVSVDALTLPRSWAAVTPEWMSGVLRSRCPGVAVSDVDLGEIDTGTTSRAFAQLTYDAGSGPDRVFVKAQGKLGHRLLLATTGTLFGEARILAHRDLLPLETPQVYGSVVERRTLRTVTVMEDVTLRDATLHGATDPLPPTNVAAALDGLARLHGRFWGRGLPEALSWVKPWRLWPGMVAFSVIEPGKGVRKLRHAGDSDLLPRVDWSAGRGLALMRHSCKLARRGPQTLLHGDAHVGNTYRLPSGQVGFYDWQFIRTGSWAHDVGYLMVSALSVDDRRANERDLLRGYLDALTREGAEDSVPSFDEAWALYQQTPAYGLAIWLGVYGIGEYQRDDLGLATIERFARAFDDLGTASVLESDGRST